MRTPTAIGMVAAVLLASGGCEKESNVVAPASVPPVPDLGAAPDGGATGGACSTTPARFAAGLAAEASDGRFVYGFAASQLLRAPIAGGTLAVVADRVDPAHDHLLMADSAFAYWVIARVGGSNVDAIVRAPSDGSAPPVAIGYGNGVESVVVADAVYFVGGGIVKSVRLGGSLAVTNGFGALLAGGAQTLAWVGPDDAFALHTRHLDAAVTTHSLGPADSDGTFLFAAMPLGEVRRYTLADGSFTVVYRTPGTNAVVLRADGDRLYVAVGGGALVRMASDGGGATTLAAAVDAPPRFVVAGDSVFYVAGGDSFRVCK